MSRVLSSRPGPSAVPNTSNANNLSSGLSEIRLTRRNPTNANLDWLEEAEDEYNPNIMAKKRAANYNYVLAAQAERAMAKQAGVGVGKLQMRNNVNPLSLKKISKELQDRYGKNKPTTNAAAPIVYENRMTRKLAGGKKKSAKRNKRQTLKKRNKY
jgi:hypothetical protein